MASLSTDIDVADAVNDKLSKEKPISELKNDPAKVEITDDIP